MSRQAIWRVIAIYFGIAALYGVLHVLATPGAGDWRWAAFIGSAIGVMIAPLLLGGLIPIIIWAFGRFRAEKAGGPIMVWGFLGALFLIAAAIGDFHEGDVAVKNIPANIGAFFSNDYDTFLRVVRNSCIESRTQTGRPSDERFNAFCQCYAESLLTQLTAQELNVALNTRVTVNPPPMWMREKTARAAIACSR